jgi:hypothetical protein
LAHKHQFFVPRLALSSLVGGLLGLGIVAVTRPLPKQPTAATEPTATPAKIASAAPSSARPTEPASSSPQPEAPQPHVQPSAAPNAQPTQPKAPASGPVPRGLPFD